MFGLSAIRSTHDSLQVPVGIVLCPADLLHPFVCVVKQMLANWKSWNCTATYIPYALHKNNHKYIEVDRKVSTRPPSWGPIDLSIKVQEPKDINRWGEDLIVLKRLKRRTWFFEGLRSRMKLDSDFTTIKQTSKLEISGCNYSLLIWP